MSDLTVAKISRCRLRGDAVSKICFLDDDLTDLQDIGVPQITTEQKMELLARVDKARIALDKYTEAVIQCMVLEGKEDYDPDDEHMVELGELEDDLDQLNVEIRFLKPRDEEEESARKSQKGPSSLHHSHLQLDLSFPRFAKCSKVSTRGADP